MTVARGTDESPSSGSSGGIRSLIYALLYALLAFWLLSADELPAPLVQRAAAALRAADLSPTSVAFYATINLLTALLPTWIFGLLEGRRVDDYGPPVRDAFWFGADHYFFKRGENVWDLVTLVSIGIWCCYTVLRTGSLWLAAGYHVAFDYMQLFVIGSQNGSVTPVNRLLGTSFEGPAWLNGGVLGTEASFLMYPVLALMFLYVSWRYPRGTKR